MRGNRAEEDVDFAHHCRAGAIVKPLEQRLTMTVEAAMSLTQLNPPLPVTIVDKGKGYAIAVIDYGQEHNLIWVTALDESGEIWCAPNPQVRFQNNWTMGRKNGLAPNDCAFPNNPN